jgi:hypothetical protein
MWIAPLDPARHTAGRKEHSTIEKGQGGGSGGLLFQLKQFERVKCAVQPAEGAAYVKLPL